MKLADAFAVARRALAEHGGIEFVMVDMRPYAQPVNPDNAGQVENAAAWNTIAAIMRLDEP